jgi:hypothetical protein
MVLAWIDGIEQRGDLDEHFDDIIADHRLAPGQILLIGAGALDLPADLNMEGPRR